jgi:hypothetical protein
LTVCIFILNILAFRGEAHELVKSVLKTVYNFPAGGTQEQGEERCVGTVWEVPVYVQQGQVGLGVGSGQRREQVLLRRSAAVAFADGLDVFHTIKIKIKIYIDLSPNQRTLKEQRTGHFLLPFFQFCIKTR